MTTKTEIVEVRRYFRGFDHWGNRSVDQMHSLFFSSKQEADLYIESVPQPSGYHGQGCEYIFSIRAVELSDGVRGAHV